MKVTLCLILLVGSSFVAIARGDDRSELAAIWNDPGFQKAFIGGYGINAEVEPRVTSEEVKILEKVRPLAATNPAAAEAALAKEIKVDGSAMLDFTLGRFQFQQEKYPLALANFEKAVTKFPSFRRAWRDIGLIKTWNNAYDDAINAFTRMIVLGGGDSYSYGLLGFAYASKRDYQAAEVAYRNALLLQPDNTKWRVQLALCVYKEDKFEDAAALLDVLIEQYPDGAEFWLLQARTYIGMKQPLRAAENLEALDILGKSTLDSLNLLGDIYASEGLMDLASAAYRRAIDVDTAQPITRPLRAAELLMARGAVPQARQITARFREVGQAQIEEADRRKLLKLEARMNAWEGASTSETAALLEEIVKLDPLDGEALILLGQHYSRNNDPDRAIFYFERAASIDAFEARAKIHHAQVLASSGRYGEALPLLRRAQEIRPREDVARLLDQIERLAKSRR